MLSFLLDDNNYNILSNDSRKWLKLIQILLLELLVYLRVQTMIVLVILGYLFLKIEEQSDVAPPSLTFTRTPSPTRTALPLLPLSSPSLNEISSSPPVQGGGGNQYQSRSPTQSQLPQ